MLHGHARRGRRCCSRPALSCWAPSAAPLPALWATRRRAWKCFPERCGRRRRPPFRPPSCKRVRRPSSEQSAADAGKRRFVYLCLPIVATASEATRMRKKSRKEPKYAGTVAPLAWAGVFPVYSSLTHMRPFPPPVKDQIFQGAPSRRAHECVNRCGPFPRRSFPTHFTLTFALPTHFTQLGQRQTQTGRMSLAITRVLVTASASASRMEATARSFASARRTADGAGQGAAARAPAAPRRAPVRVHCANAIPTCAPCAKQVRPCGVGGRRR